MKSIKALFYISLIILGVLFLPLNIKADELLPDNTPVWFDAEYYAINNPDVVSVYCNGNNTGSENWDSKLWKHYKEYGYSEGRMAAATSDWFDASFYASNNEDVTVAFGTEVNDLFRHYVKYGRKEGRLPNAEYAHTLEFTGEEKSTEKVNKASAVKSPYSVTVNRTTNICTVYSQDSAGEYTVVEREMICSTGRKGHLTPLGTFKIYEHSAGWHYMVDGTYSKWCMRFKKGGYMFHTVCYENTTDAEPIPEEIEELGTNASRGCIRLGLEDAEWMFNTVPNGTVVNIVD